MLAYITIYCLKCVGEGRQTEQTKVDTENIKGEQREKLNSIRESIITWLVSCSH